mgnify:CR=1 FL=1
MKNSLFLINIILRQIPCVYIYAVTILLNNEYKNIIENSLINQSNVTNLLRRLNECEIGGHRRSYSKVNAKSDYYKQFFFLLFQAMKLNSENIEPYLKVNSEQLYEQCKKDKIPFHKYENFIKQAVESKIKPKPKEKTEEYKNLIGFISSNLV